MFAFSHSLLFLSSGSQPGTNLSRIGHLAISGDIFDCHDWEDANDIQWVEARDAAEHLMMHRPALNNEELSGPKC